MPLNEDTARKPLESQPRLTCQAAWLGRVPYQQAWQLQDRLAQAVAAGQQPPTLLLLEHPHTFTFGRSGEADNLLWSEAELEAKGVELHWVDRGGDVTYHGPGQLVGYPILPLGEVDAHGHLPGPDYVGYLRRLEKTLIRTLAAYGVSGSQLDGLTGVWVEQDDAMLGRASKIAAIGVKVDARGVSRHGFALNVAPDMSYWQGIVPCGIDDRPVTSLARLLQEYPTVQQVAESAASAFGEIFDFDMRWQPLPDLAG